MAVKSDIEIAREAKKKPIQEIGSRLGIGSEHLLPFGHDKAKVSADFIKSLTRIRDSDVKWLLPSHGPVFKKDNALIDKTLARLEGYLHMADFGTCAADWPLMDEWEEELVEGKPPA